MLFILSIGVHKRLQPNTTHNLVKGLENTEYFRTFSMTISWKKYLVYLSPRSGMFPEQLLDTGKETKLGLRNKSKATCKSKASLSLKLNNF